MNKLKLMIATVSLATIVSAPGCATVTYTALGPFGGAFDAAAYVHHKLDRKYLRYPAYLGLSILGAAGGPLSGFINGLIMDYKIITGKDTLVTYAKLDWLMFGAIPYSALFGLD